MITWYRRGRRRPPTAAIVAICIITGAIGFGLVVMILEVLDWILAP